MKCLQARRALLDADLRDLAGEGSSPLAAHLRECPACRARAEAILAGEAELAGALTHPGAIPDLEEILRRAGTRSRGGETPRKTFPFAPFTRPGRITAALIPLAAAAVAVLFLAREPDLPGTEFSPSRSFSGLEVEAPEGQSVAILQTNNPDISVVWIF